MVYRIASRPRRPPRFSRRIPDTRRRLAAIAIGVALFVAGCAGPAPTPPATASPEAAGETPTPVATATPPPGQQDGPPAVVSPLKRRDAPPGGVDAQLAFVGPTAGCDVSDAPGPPEPGPDFEAQVAHWFCIDFFGFDPEQASVEFVLTAPDGTELVRTALPTEGGSASFRFQPTLAYPKGVYQYVVAQPAPVAPQSSPADTTQPSVATGTFQLVAATTPGSVAMTPSLPRGGAVQIGLAGFPAGSAVETFVYEAITDPNSGSYLTALPRVTVDGIGEALLTIQTAPDDPPGRYAVVTRPATSDRWCLSESICAVFEVTP
ncbi:MAG TPA: hypothetical protein VHK06_06560 [Candidatus Limnocylindria bacterium]|nr:hypothetical protein [Candidatus Limnocylindria bacterium]